MKAYVAGASAEIARARRVIAALRDLGFEITGDWPAVIDAHNGRANEGLTEDERVAAAHACIQAAIGADVLLLLVPHTATSGAWAELAAAHASGRLVIASGYAPDFARSIMTALADHSLRCDECVGAVSVPQREADDRAIAWLCGYAAAREAAE